MCRKARCIDDHPFIVGLLRTTLQIQGRRSTQLWLAVSTNPLFFDAVSRWSTPVDRPVRQRKTWASCGCSSKLRGTSDGRANFLWDNSLYLLGVNGDGQLEDGLKSFNKSKVLHDEVLADCEGPVSKALKASMHIGTPSKGGLTRFPGLAMTCRCKGKFLAFCVDFGSDFTEAYADSESRRVGVHGIRAIAICRLWFRL